MLSIHKVIRKITYLKYRKNHENLKNKKFLIVNVQTVINRIQRRQETSFSAQIVGFETYFKMLLFAFTIEIITLR